MLIRIDFESETPIYEQLKNQLVIGMAKGELRRGESLPSVRQMAEDIGINLHTVNKVYNILKQEGYLNIDRRIGAVINENMPERTEEFSEKLIKELEYVIADCKCRDISKKEFLDICSKIYDDYNS
ncbi:GntR family transcriptional regulator [Clostridium acetobutylicum]|uniref:Transcriptional regulator, GntR family n=1 Tax=Clostridium acetobutylicum (strain ATCC 824 / DSM 792 / JCM 1419 / IAM 19013 / LMG 5710 / NBRC 13948 / NRRL B-527 / VKM B-1787 / 2291 / W) TaxID=272562 RepID=Q97LG2_CLOAB|nr:MULTISPECIES: GntR family transcriptional regulator [Clostridium]AAK78577.1 Transcriptional regulator, GntR family [Clostridium acetobutylicum ATCC 824]ADZ19651.1 Transcriptional regulator, GntR family [Clostridium acetobutylicum EA 2018]AEI31327.1 GntR family transcriptional regulator [Clostridium acetobutylicum DSM 1731]AWV80301.1 GntR family transcriptional regulator [Clostridium acetobutylicum]MBC2392486.1 GntR family transcriptional regulator [Clostridium acetobutylicum]